MKTANQWTPPLKINSKKVKLPKTLWKKGKSKFADIRMHDEGELNLVKFFKQILVKEKKQKKLNKKRIRKVNVLASK